MEILKSLPMVNGLSAPALTRKVSLSRHALPESIQAVILILGLLQLTAPANGVSTRVVFSGGTSVQEYDGSNTTPTVEYKQRPLPLRFAIFLVHQNFGKAFKFARLCRRVISTNDNIRFKRCK